MDKKGKIMLHYVNDVASYKVKMRLNQKSKPRWRQFEIKTSTARNVSTESGRQQRAILLHS